MTLGFGTTLIGEAVDYAIYFLIQARGGAGSSERWRRESWPTVRLGLFTSLIGFAALVFTGFPGLAQLGVFSIAGLAAAAATTRFVFPVIAPERRARRRLSPPARPLHGAAARALPRLRWAVAALAAAAVVALLVVPSPWRGELSSLSPIAPAELAARRRLARRPRRRRRRHAGRGLGAGRARRTRGRRGGRPAPRPARRRRRAARLRLAGAPAAARGDPARAPRRPARVGAACARASPKRPPAARCPRRGCSLSSLTSPRRERKRRSSARISPARRSASP